DLETRPIGAEDDRRGGDRHPAAVDDVCQRLAVKVDLRPCRTGVEAARDVRHPRLWRAGMSRDPLEDVLAGRLPVTLVEGIPRPPVERGGLAEVVLEFRVALLDLVLGLPLPVLRLPALLDRLVDESPDRLQVVERRGQVLLLPVGLV